MERHLDAVEIAASLAGGDDGAHHVVAQETAGDARGGVAVVLAARGGGRRPPGTAAAGGRGGHPRRAVGVLRRRRRLALHPLPTLHLAVVFLSSISPRPSSSSSSISASSSSAPAAPATFPRKVEPSAVAASVGDFIDPGTGFFHTAHCPLASTSASGVLRAPRRPTHDGVVRDAPHHLLRGDVPHARRAVLPGGEQVLAVWRPRDERHITRVSSLGSLARVLGRHQAVVLELGPGAAFEEGDVALASGHGEHGARRDAKTRGSSRGRRAQSRAPRWRASPRHRAPRTRRRRHRRPRRRCRRRRWL